MEDSRASDWHFQQDGWSKRQFSKMLEKSQGALPVQLLKHALKLY
jgi:hypothetical protein